MGVKLFVAETISLVEMNQPGSFYHTNILKELGGVNEILRYAFDDELWVRFFCKYGIKNIYLVKWLRIFACMALQNSRRDSYII